MKTSVCIYLFAILSSQFAFEHKLYGQENMNKEQTLDARQQAIVPIAAYTARGNMIELSKALYKGLDSGLSISEIKEMLVHLYAYTGFPRSLNALNNFMGVVKERQLKGMKDDPGKDPNPLPADKNMLQLGTENQTKLVGKPVKGEIYEFAPAIDQFLKEHLFGAIFGRDILDFKTRELVTISALVALGGVENQLKSHLTVGMYNGITEAQLKQLVSIIQANVSAKEGDEANRVLQTVLDQKQGISKTESSANKAGNSTPDKLDSYSPDPIFPKGTKITNQNFEGNAWLYTMDSTSYTSVGNVAFEPGARTKWHYHPDGQMLLVIDGVGYYQEKGSPKRILHKGDVVKCPPNKEHWHGASRDQQFIQVAITGRQNGPTVWLQKVSDEEYNSEVKE